jgi:thymidine phosphorylase
MDPIGVIEAKRDGRELSTAQIAEIIEAFTAGDVAPEQMSSLLMAIVLNDMGRRETADWTAAMIDSGVRLDLGDLPTVDKHSTGGVGDKITLPLTPLVASYGLVVPQLSGRGLGHTGGTLDKLESIRGWRAELSVDEMTAQLRDVGAVICAGTADLAPADRKLYALRDVTGTVASIPLIASSIMSKKIAEGTRALVLDVKSGSGAFLPSVDDARELARAMVSLGADAGVDTRALLTDMSTPLGRSAGNAVEVAESVEVLAGGGPSDVVELTLALAREMLDAGGLGDVDPAENLQNGRAMDKWRMMIAAQGGDPDAPLPDPRHVHEVRAGSDGVLVSLDALAVGHAAWRLGAGRSRPGEAVSYAAGVQWHVGLGERVRAGQTLFTLHTDDASRFDAALDSLAEAAVIGDAVIGDAEPTRRSLVLDRVVSGCP